MRPKSFGVTSLSKKSPGSYFEPASALRDLELRIGDFALDDVAAVIDLVVAGLPVDRDDRVRFGAEVPLVGGNQRRFERFEQALEADVALVLDLAERRDHLCIHRVCSLSFRALEVRADVVLQVRRLDRRERNRQFAAAASCSKMTLSAHAGEHAAMRFGVVDRQGRDDSHVAAAKAIVVGAAWSAAGRGRPTRPRACTARGTHRARR